MTRRVLVIDDDAAMCDLLESGLRKRSYEVTTALSTEDAKSALAAKEFDVAVTDLKLGGEDGLALCQYIVENRPQTPVIVVTAFGSMDTAVAAIRAGAYDFITKPISLDALVLALDRAVSHKDLREEVRRLKEAVDQHPHKDLAMIGDSRALEKIRDLIDRASFSYTRQNEMKGLGHAILMGRPLIGDNAFAVVLADDLCLNQDGDGVLTQMVKLYRQFRCSIVAVMEVPRERISSYGVIAGEPVSDNIIRVTDMVEKPPADEAPSNLAVIGRYILTPDIFELIDQTPPGKNGEVQITDALLTQARESCVMAYRFQGRRFDCGSVPGFVEATNFCFEHHYVG
jgi:UTP--glucose-1-phosphate uridylyltransferase